jgi:hypothetical protein
MGDDEKVKRRIVKRFGARKDLALEGGRYNGQ